MPDDSRRPAVALEGGCTCKAVRYRVTAEPLIVHCCHCRWCQRETGASFALNAVIETTNVVALATPPELVHTPSQSGKGQKIHRCSQCRVAVWSNYAGGGDAFVFVRVGTLDAPDRFPPDVHIYCSSKQPWVVIPPDAKAYHEFYHPKDVWSPAALQRWAALKG